MYAAFVDLKKAFDRVPRKVLWWSLRKLGIDEWVIRLVKAMYSNTKPKAQVNDSSSAGIEIRIFNMPGHKKYDIGKANKRP